MGIKTFRDLKIWEKGMEVTKMTYMVIKNFPQNENYALSSQMRRAAVSIPSNIAEGFGRDSKKEFQHFLHFALGSLFELQTQAEIAYDLAFLDVETYNEFNELLKELERMMCSFIASNKNLITKDDRH